VQNAYVESFNGRLRDECLNANWFTRLSDARKKIEAWRLGLQPPTSAQFTGLLAARRVCRDSSGDEGMRKARTGLINGLDGRLGSFSTARASRIEPTSNHTVVAVQLCVRRSGLQSGHGGAMPLNLRYAII
jgi:hypothetical protein